MNNKEKPTVRAGSTSIVSPLGVLFGIDGGGTRSTLAVVSEDGQIQKKIHGAGLNYHLIGMDAARKNLKELFENACAACEGSEVQALSVGTAALDDFGSPEECLLLTEGLLPPEKTLVFSDTQAALYGASLGMPGIVVISGTGAMVMGIDTESRRYSRCGWGYLLGDCGSSFGIASDALRIAAEEWEGLRDAGKISETALNFFALREPRDLITKLYGAASAPTSLAQFAAAVIRLAQRGDAEAAAIIEKNLKYLAQNVLLLASQHAEMKQIWAYGGVFQHNQWIFDRFSEMLSSQNSTLNLARPILSPELGAVVLYWKEKNELSEKRIQNLIESEKPENEFDKNIL